MTSIERCYLLGHSFSYPHRDLIYVQCTQCGKIQRGDELITELEARYADRVEQAERNYGEDR